MTDRRAKRQAAKQQAARKTTPADPRHSKHLRKFYNKFVDIFTPKGYSIYRKCMEVINVAIATNILQCLIPISQFNKGQASKIFDRLHDEKELIVLKNNQPSAVILSPEEYTRLTEIEEDYYLLIEAAKRIEDNGNKETVSMDYVMRNLGIDKKELENAEDIDIE